MRVSVAFLTAIAAIAIPGAAQDQRRAAIVGGGDRNGGKCTVEVVVDGAADVEIRGDTGNIRTSSGRPAQWRRFQCTGPIPRNPAGFRFVRVDGRGRQQLVRDPRNGGSAVVRIEDREGGAEGYTFDLIWGGGNLSGDPRWYDEGTYRPPNGEPYSDRDRADRRIDMQQAVAACQDAVRQEASRRLGSSNVEFRGAGLDATQGQGDWIVGSIDVPRGPGSERRYQFSCSVNWDNGRVRSLRLDPVRDYGSRRDRDRDDTPTSIALERCQSAVQDRLRQSGYGRVDFSSIRMDDRPGRRDWVVGEVLTGRGYGDNERLEFSCMVDLQTGDLRSVDVTRR